MSFSPSSKRKGLFEPKDNTASSPLSRSSGGAFPSTLVSSYKSSPACAAYPSGHSNSSFFSSLTPAVLPLDPSQSPSPENTFSSPVPSKLKRFSSISPQHSPPPDDDQDVIPSQFSSSDYISPSDPTSLSLFPEPL
mmetsp:Transcript_33306/g.52068  ORF Transcript_33306/g.52068 Transcript_33306/m.52068 type:complete len:136 (-) Transcript_33306:2405-2812(-)